MDRIRRWFVFIVMLAVIGGGMWLWWSLDLRGSPHTLKKEQASLAYELQRTGWVSPHVNGKIVYVLVNGECIACGKFETGALEALQKRGVDTRVIVVAPAVIDAKTASSPEDRATVAEFWLNRDWNLYRRWRERSPATMAGEAPADGNAARTAVVETANRSAATIADLLKRNGVKFGYPMAIWWNKTGDMRASLVDNSTAARKAEQEIAAG